MIRRREEFDAHLQALVDEVLVMGGMVEKAVVNATDALKARDLEASRRIVSEDDAIDRQRFLIEDQCVDLIATQQPMARDLRTIIAVLHITNELERMGDYAEGIAQISLMMGSEPPLKPLIDIPHMADLALHMLRRALNALVTQDVIAAERVCRDDDQVDALYDQVYRELLIFMLRDSSAIRRATYLLWVAHDLERTADRATNIAEQVIYWVTGIKVEINTAQHVR